MRADVKLRRSLVNIAPKHIRNDRNASEFVRLSDLRELSECQQTAAVCYRIRGTEIEFLLVRTRGSRRWTFPKGSTEPGLTPAQAAALEAFEEAGVHGRIEQSSFAHYISRKRGKSKRRLLVKETTVNAHLCEVLRLSKPKEAGRDRTWFSPQEAKKRLRKGRDNGSAIEFARTVEKAVLRVERLQKEQNALPGRTNENLGLRTFPVSLFDRDSLRKDALRKVEFEPSPQIHDWTRVRLLPNSVQRLDTSRRSSSLTGDQPRKLLLGEVLPFNAAPATNLHSQRTRKQVSGKR